MDAAHAPRWLKQVNVTEIARVACGIDPPMADHDTEACMEALGTVLR